MFKLLAYFVIITLISGIVAWIGDHTGAIVINWLGYRVSLTLTSGLIILGTIALLVVLLLEVVWALFRFPTRLRNQRNLRRMERSWVELTRGMTALISHDTRRATKYSRRLLVSMENEPLAHMLAAFTAQQAGDVREARKHYESLLDFKDTEMIGIRGLPSSSGEHGKLEKAISLAERAYKNNPEAKGIASLLLSLYKRGQKWQEALTLIDSRTSIFRKALDNKDWKKSRGFVLHMQARQAERKGELETALILYREALEATPCSIPLVIDYAEIAGTPSNNSRLATIIEKCWKETPHPDLATRYFGISDDVSPKNRLKMAKKLSSYNPVHTESHIILASAYAENGDYYNARETLKHALSEKETIRLAGLMEQYWKKDKSADPEKGEEWERRARNAVADDTWACSECLSINEAWSPVCPDCDAVDSISWGSPKPKRAQSPQLPLLNGVS